MNILKNPRIKISIFVFAFALFVSLACGSDKPSEQQKTLEEAGLVEPSRSSPETAAEAVFNIWVQKQGIPNRNIHYELINNDDTFAIVRIIGEFRETSNSPWLEVYANTECKKVSDKWQCNEFLSFNLTPEQQAEATRSMKGTATAQAQESIATATAEVKATIAAATAEAEAVERSIKLISVDSISEVMYQNPDEMGTQPRFWDMVIRNDDQKVHKLQILFTWDEEARIGDDWRLDSELESGGLIQKGDKLIKHWTIQPGNILFEVAPQTKQSFKVVIDYPDINIPSNDWYGNGQNLVAHILTVDEIPVRKPEEIWSSTEILASNSVLERDSYGGYDYRCQISLINNDAIPHQFSGEIKVNYGYSYLGDPSTSENSIYLDIGRGNIGKMIRPSETFMIVAEGDIDTKETLLTSFEIESINFSLNDYIYSKLTEEERRIEIDLPNCTPSF